MSTRKITDNQFSDKTTIDGNRLDDAIENVTERINSVETGDIQHRFIESQLVSSWMVCRGNANAGQVGYQYPYHGTLLNENFAPWLRMFNSTNDEVDGKTSANQYRMKGTFNPYFTTNDGIDHVEQDWGGKTGDSTQYVWTQSHQQEDNKSSILNAVNFQMIYDGRYTQNDYIPAPSYGDEFQYSFIDAAAAGFLGPDYQVGLPLKDVHVVVDVDFPFDPEERKLNSKLIGRHLFRVDAEMISFYQIPTDDVLGGTALGTHAMLPNVSSAAHNAALSSLSINLRDLAIPIPAGARLRWSLVIPLYGDDIFNPQIIQVGPWAFDPMARFSWGSTLTLLEEIRG